MSIRIRLAATAALAALPLITALTSALPARAQLALYAPAKAEGAVVLYVGGPTAPWEEMAKKFSARYPGIKFSISGGFSNLVTFDSIYNITTALKKQNLPVESHFAEKDATPIWPLSGAIFKRAPHPNAAKLFHAWLLEPEQQIATETWSGRRDVPPPKGYKPILSYQVANDYKAFMTNDAQIAELRKPIAIAAIDQATRRGWSGHAALPRPSHALLLV